MTWYYADQNKQKGPFTDEDFQNLVRSGAVNAATLVWHDGMAEWKPYGQVGGAGEPVAATMPVQGGGIICTECGKVFTADEVIPFGEVYVCAACKPVFLQKLKEGAPVARKLEFAGFWIRVAAKMLDGLILGLPLIIVFILVGATAFQSPEKGELGAKMMLPMLLQLILQLAFVFLSAGYSIFFIGRYGATPGKMACKLRVVTADGEKVTYGRATGRFFADMLSGMICYIGYMMAGFDKEQHRALHDYICNTRVIKV